MAETGTGVLFWVTGLAGAGKTTLSTILTQRLRGAGHAVVHLDGDQLREVFDAGAYTPEERFRLAQRYSALAQVLVGQGLDVVLSTISMFSALRQTNRLAFANYFEVYLKVPMEVLHARDQKGLYSRATEDGVANVVGIDIAIDEPKSPDITIVNDGSETPEQCVDRIIAAFAQRWGGRR